MFSSSENTAFVEMCDAVLCPGEPQQLTSSCLQAPVVLKARRLWPCRKLLTETKALWCFIHIVRWDAGAGVAHSIECMGMKQVSGPPTCWSEMAMLVQGFQFWLVKSIH